MAAGHRSRSSRGFTLIELLAVMAIIAILAAIIAPSVSGTKDTSQEAQAAQDGIQVRNAATEYFSDRDLIEGLTTQSTSTLLVGVATNSETYTGSNATTTSAATQKISSRWPEKFITSSSTSTNSIYYVEFPITGSANDLTIVYVVDDDDKTIAANTLFGKYTAVDTATLVSQGYLEVAPGTADDTTTQGSTAAHDFLWLLKKSTSPGSPTEDARDVAVFKLAETSTVTIPNGTLPSLTKYVLVYRRVF
jgi:prepilin-type N-terminal cleavage/methylation domain-containing protein